MLCGWGGSDLLASLPVLMSFYILHPLVAAIPFLQTQGRVFTDFCDNIGTQRWLRVNQERKGASSFIVYPRPKLPGLQSHSTYYSDRTISQLPA